MNYYRNTKKPLEQDQNDVPLEYTFEALLPFETNHSAKQDRQCMYNLKLRGVHATITEEKIQ